MIRAYVAGKGGPTKAEEHSRAGVPGCQPAEKHGSGETRELGTGAHSHQGEAEALWISPG